MNCLKKAKNIFSDKASLVLRKMLASPDKHWVVRDFIGGGEISLGMAQGILEALEIKGHAQRIKKGPSSYTVLGNTDKVLEDWTRNYAFEGNREYVYYSEDKNILKKIKECINGKSYALTLHTAANFYTSFVKSEDVFLYLKSSEWEKDVLNLRERLGLKELVKGGNIHLIRPYYKTGAFYNTQIIKGYTLTSNLQLYLDLYHFQPRGREQAEVLKEFLKEKGRILD